MLKRLLDDSKHTGITGIVAVLTLNQYLEMSTVLRLVLAILAEIQSSSVWVHSQKSRCSFGGIIMADYLFIHQRAVHHFRYDFRERV